MMQRAAILFGRYQSSSGRKLILKISRTTIISDNDGTFKSFLEFQIVKLGNISNNNSENNRFINNNPTITL
jgi:hypothetical protein